LGIVVGAVPALQLARVNLSSVLSILACLGPARRAARVSPIVALSHQ
jgi:ABC-type lipoprotein release transport system permease subunit